MAEDASLAQIVRLFHLAKALPTDRYELHFASQTFPSIVFNGHPDILQHPLYSIPREVILERTRRNRV